ncbi:hypothetical protein AB3M89_03255 [Microbacterium sp. 179-I 3D2 NHS]|uniref:hypothetical protein n=1 Tax=Microbacterium sp. 179-I 3D2 NHS TaxID=3235178 RepID=UPI0039A1D762
MCLAAIAALSVSSGCSALPVSDGSGSSSSRPTPDPTADSTADSAADSNSGDVTFAAGAELAEGSDISWGDGLIADAGWVSVPSDHPGRWAYANLRGTCTAAFRGGVLGDAGGMDDREATDALIAQQSGEDFLGAEMLTDGGFLRYEHPDAVVEHRQFSYTFNGFGYFMAARAFVEPDYSVWVIVTCEGEPVGPVAEEVLSKNMIVVNAAP